MLQFDLCRIAGENGLFVVVQHDMLDERDTTVIVPLETIDNAPVAATRLNPRFDVDGSEYVMLTSLLAAVRKQILRQTGKTLAPERDRIIAALDFLFTGF